MTAAYRSRAFGGPVEAGPTSSRQPAGLRGAGRTPAVVIGRLRPSRPLWETTSGSGERDVSLDAFVVDLLRVRRAAEPATIEVLGSASLSWESGLAIGEPLERLGWRTAEPVVLAVPTPALVGGSFNVRVTPPGSDGDGGSAAEPQRVHGSPQWSRRGASGDSRVAAPYPTWYRGAGEPHHADLREQVREARWRARERAREDARRFFNCSLERVHTLTEDVVDIGTESPSGAVRAVISCLVQEGPRSPHAVTPPADIPRAHLVLLPLVLEELFCGIPGCIGLVLIEEERLTYTLFEEEHLLFLRSFPLGAANVLTHLMHTIGCSPREATTLLSLADEGMLPEDSQRLLVKALRPLLPLFGGIWRIVQEELRQEPRPVRCFVAGYWPGLLLRLFGRSSFRTRCLHSSTVLHTLLRPAHTWVSPKGSPTFLHEAFGGLVSHFADAVLRYEAGTAESWPHLTEPRGRSGHAHG